MTQNKDKHTPIKATLPILLCLLFPLYAVAQTEDTSTEETVDTLSISDKALLLDRIMAFQEESAELADNIGSAQQAQLASISHFAQQIDARWAAFYASNQAQINNDEELVNTVSDYELSIQAVYDSISARKTILEQYQTFLAAEKYFHGKQTEYEKMQKMAEKLALVKLSAPMLDKLKAREQLAMAELQKNYDEAKNAAASNPKLEKRMAEIEEEFVAIKSISGKIQEAQYQPFLIRIKDMLLSLAAVAIILLFVSFIIARISAVRKAAKAAKEMKKMLEKQNNDIPTI